jgi:site-specific recombinase XerD
VSEKAGRALTSKEVPHMLCGPDRATPEGARDCAILLPLARLGVRVSELCAKRASSLSRSTKGWAVTL